MNTKDCWKNLPLTADCGENREINFRILRSLCVGRSDEVLAIVVENLGFVFKWHSHSNKYIV